MAPPMSSKITHQGRMISSVMKIMSTPKACTAIAPILHSKLGS